MSKSSDQTQRERRAQWLELLVYTCEPCDLTIKGHSGDPYEAPWMYCPECDEEMELEVRSP